MARAWSVRARPPPNRALAPQAAAVAVEEPLPPRPRSACRLRLPIRGRLARRVVLTTGPHSRGALEEVVLLPPQGALSRSSGERSPSVSLSALQPLDVGEDSPAHGLADPSRLFSPPSASRRSGGAEPERPTAPGYFSSGRGRGGWTDHLGEVGQDLGVEGVRLGESAGGAWQKSRTCRGFTTATECLLGQRSRQGHLKPPVASKTTSGLQSFEAGHEGGDPTQVMGNAPGFAAGTHRHIQLGFGHINANIDARFLLTASSLLARPCRMRALRGPRNCSGLLKDRRGDPSSPTVSYDPGT